MRTREKLCCFSLVFYVRMSGTMGNQRCVMLGVTCRVKCRNTSCYRRQPFFCFSGISRVDAVASIWYGAISHD